MITIPQLLILSLLFLCLILMLLNNLGRIKIKIQLILQTFLCNQKITKQPVVDISYK